MNHVLVIGGTGMMRGVSLGLAIRAKYVSVVARNEGRLAELAQEAEHLPGTLMPWAADYRSDPALATTITSATEAFGSIDTVVAWIHSDAENAAVLVARLIGSEGRAFHWFDVTGTGDPESGAMAGRRRAELELVRKLRYHRIQLRRMREGDESRWLTHDEIARGILAAVDAGQAEAVVGE